MTTLDKTIVGAIRNTAFRHGFVTREALNKLIPFMVRQAHHERNQPLAVRPEPVEGLIQRLPRIVNTSFSSPVFLLKNIHKLPHFTALLITALPGCLSAQARREQLQMAQQEEAQKAKQQSGG